MSSEDDLPSPPDDAWRRIHRFETVSGRMAWVRPRNLVEEHARIEHLAPHDAQSLLSSWLADPFLRSRLESLHDSAFGPAADLDSDARGERVRLALADAVASGWLVVHAERIRGGAPGSEPVQPKPPKKPPGSVRPDLTRIEIAVLEKDTLSPVPDEPIRLMGAHGFAHDLRTDRGGVARLGALVSLASLIRRNLAGARRREVRGGGRRWLPCDRTHAEKHEGPGLPP